MCKKPKSPGLLVKQERAPCRGFLGSPVSRIFSLGAIFYDYCLK